MGRAYMSDDFDNDNDDIGFSEDALDTGSYVAAAETSEMATTQEDSPEARTVTSRCRIREQLEHDIQAYLQHGGAIHHAEQGSMPPPSSRYQDDYWNPLL